MRALATVSVIDIHASYWPAYNPFFTQIRLLSRFAVPAFVLLTGVLLGYRYAGRPFAKPQFLRRRFSRTLIPWLSWVPVFILFGLSYTGDPKFSLQSIASFFAWGTGHLWFLLVIPQMYLLLLIWPKQRLMTIAMACLILQLGLDITRLWATLPNSILEEIFLWHGFQFFFFWIGYFAFGLALGDRLRLRGEPEVWRCSGSVFWFLAVIASGWFLLWLPLGGAPHANANQGTGAFLAPQMPLFVLAMAGFLLYAAPAFRHRYRRLQRVISQISDHSLGIYIIHPLFLFPFGRWLHPVLNWSFPGSICGLVLLDALALMAAWLTATLLAATPAAITLGEKRQRD